MKAKREVNNISYNFNRGIFSGEIEILKNIWDKLNIS